MAVARKLWQKMSSPKPTRRERRLISLHNSVAGTKGDN
jgi:hypothetical protein